jgi:anti-sigma factor RsiW
MDGDLPDGVREQIDEHLRQCDHCTAVYDGVRNVVALVGAHGSFELPEGFSGRLYRKLSAQFSNHGRR